MQRKQLLSAVIVALALCGRSAGQRTLDRAEVLDLFRVLTDEPRDTWIASGVIHARHLEYRAAADQILESDVTIRYDGDRFYWEVNIDSDNGGPASGRGPSRGGVDVSWNRNRLFVWDGQKYTLYFKPGNQAIVYEDTSRVPIVVNGPLTAGLIPWGYGTFTYEALSGAQVSAIETQRDGRTVTELTVSGLAGTAVLQMTFLLDREKDYAVLASTVRNEGRSIVVGTCDGYRLVGGRWVPATVEVERYDDGRTPAQRLSFDRWDLTSVSTQITEAAPFEAGLAPDARVEEYTKLSEKPLAYYRRPQADTEALRRMRLEIIAAGKTSSVNCAAVTTRYVLSRAGKEMTQQEAASLAPKDGTGASLHAIKAVLAGAGLNCRAVRTNIDALRKVKDCLVILHLPARKHFIVLDHIDDRRVWLIDLDHNRFYYPRDIDSFSLDWPDGTALLVSQQSPGAAEGLDVIPETELKQMVGADSFGTYSCSQLIQDYHVVYCSPGIGVPCEGRYQVYEPRYACELDAAGGSCDGQALIGSMYMDCIENPFSPGDCTTTGDWIVRYMHACR